MKNSIFLTALIGLAFFFSGCQPEPVLPPGSEYGIFCEDLNLGRVSFEFKGKNWESNCLIPSTAEVQNSEGSFRYFTIIAYDFDGNFYLGADVEIFTLTYSESIENGITTIETTAGFYESFYDTDLAANDPDYETEGRSFSSDEDEKGQVQITNFTAEKAVGTFEFDLFEEDSGEKITAKGSFDVRFEE